MDKIEELRKQYYESIRLLQNEQDIFNALPQPEYENFFPLIRGIIKMLEDELKENQKELLNELEAEMKAYIQDEINIILLKIELCSKLLQKGIQDKTIEVEALVTPKKNIIFATTDSGNMCIENDLKDIPEEFYASVEKLLIKLQEGVVEDNVEKAKTLTTVDKKMVGLHEIKEFKIRLFYKNLSPDTVYVLLVRMKKSNNNSIDRKDIINRASQRNKQYEQLKKDMNDSVKKSALIQEHQEILDKLFGHIQKNKR